MSHLTLPFSRPPAGAPVANASGVTAEWVGCNGRLARPGWLEFAGLQALDVRLALLKRWGIKEPLTIKRTDPLDST